MVQSTVVVAWRCTWQLSSLRPSACLEATDKTAFPDRVSSSLTLFCSDSPDFISSIRKLYNREQTRGEDSTSSTHVAGSRTKLFSRIHGHLVESGGNKCMSVSIIDCFHKIDQ